jgi:hypothetical protein
MSSIARESPRRPRAGRPAPDALARLRADPAVRAADPAAREWLLALLERGEHEKGIVERIQAEQT